MITHSFFNESQRDDFLKTLKNPNDAEMDYCDETMMFRVHVETEETV